MAPQGHGCNSRLPRVLGGLRRAVLKWSLDGDVLEGAAGLGEHLYVLLAVLGVDGVRRSLVDDLGLRGLGLRGFGLGCATAAATDGSLYFIVCERLCQFLINRRRTWMLCAPPFLPTFIMNLWPQ